jgi:hypothetical protein
MNSKLRMLSLAALSAPLLLVGSTALAGVSGPAFYVDGELYRTVGTPADLPQGPAHSHDTIYAIDGQPNVATAAPGDVGYNGGRWEVHALAFPNGYDAAVDVYDDNGSGDFDSADEIYAAMEGGYITDLGIVRRFECPVIPLPRNNR